MTTPKPTLAEVQQIKKTLPIYKQELTGGAYQTFEGVVDMLLAVVEERDLLQSEADSMQDSAKHCEYKHQRFGSSCTVASLLDYKRALDVKS